jgi:putative transposase
VRDVLSQVLRERAQKMLQTAIQKAVDEYLQNRSDIVGEDGRRLVIRNGSLPERELMTGVGAIQLRQPSNSCTFWRMTKTMLGVL